LYAARRFGRAAVVMTVHNYRMLCANGLLFRNGRNCTKCLTASSVLPAIRHGCYRNSRLATLPVAFSIAVHRRLRTYYRVPDAVIALTAFQRDMLKSAVGVDNVFVKPSQYSDPPNRVPWSERASGILYVGRLSVEKGVDVLIDALHRTPDPPHCDIVGDGAERAALEARVDHLGLAGRIRFHGMLPEHEARRRIGHARLLVIPSVCNEGFPLVLREAMALGVPVVASRIGSLAEIVTDGRTGRLFDVGCPDALAATLREVLDAPALLKRMADNSFQEFLSKYSETGVYDTLIAVYAKASARRALTSELPC
jgi:glycosyltransferase involved in cell wall biosynthesis